MPVPAAGQPDVGIGDPHPLVLGRRLQQLLQQESVGGRDAGALAKSGAAFLDPGRQRIANLLQLTEAERARLVRLCGHGGVDLHPREGLDDDVGEMTLEAADLAPQLSAGKTLVASYPKRRETVSIEQIRHRAHPECSSRHRPLRRLMR
jgi:hypothetical protein